MMPVRTLAAALVAFRLSQPPLLLPGTQTQPGPCVPTSQDRITCGSGPGALMVLDGTTSPSGKLAIAWRSRSGRRRCRASTAWKTTSSGSRMARASASSSGGRGTPARRGATTSPRRSPGPPTAAGCWLAMAANGLSRRSPSTRSMKAPVRPRAWDCSAPFPRRRPACCARTSGRAKQALTPWILPATRSRSPIRAQSRCRCSSRCRRQDKDIDLLVKFRASRNGDHVTTTPIDVSVIKR